MNKDDSTASYGDLVDLARTGKPGSNGLFFIPHLRGGSPPVSAPYSKACFLGIRDYHTKADFVRSIFEGLSLEVCGVLEHMESVLGIEFDNIHAIGGGSKNPLWMQIKSTVTNRPIEIPEVQESTLLGAALLGGIGAGVYRNHEQASKATYRCGHSYHPDETTRKTYKEIYQTYQTILPLAREISYAIKEA
jgi:xylulokinase